MNSHFVQNGIFLIIREIQTENFSNSISEITAFVIIGPMNQHYLIQIKEKFNFHKLRLTRVLFLTLNLFKVSALQAFWHFLYVFTYSKAVRTLDAKMPTSCQNKCISTNSLHLYFAILGALNCTFITTCINTDCTHYAPNQLAVFTDYRVIYIKLSCKL